MTWNNAYLMMQLINVMKINVEVDKKLNLKPKKYPKEKKLEDK